MCMYSSPKVPTAVPIKTQSNALQTLSHFHFTLSATEQPATGEGEQKQLQQQQKVD